jgi:hypothetical protein
VALHQQLTAMSAYQSGLKRKAITAV